ncbi:hypothetical protein O0544_22575 [Edwardsiella anguillarum]|nr:hypothetical protein [Edwardsiella anguillarum]
MYFATEDNFWRFYANACGQWGWCVVASTGYIVHHSAVFFPGAGTAWPMLGYTATGINR